MKARLLGMLRGAARFWLGDQGLSAFLILLFLALFLGPFIHSRLVSVFTSIFLSLLMVAGVANISSHAGIRMCAGVVAFTAIVLRWLTDTMPSPAITLWSSSASLIFMVLLTVGIFYRVFTDDKPVTRDRIRGAIAAYLLFGITCSMLYGLLDQTLPHAFSHSVADGYSGARQEEIIYFSFVTLATLGYGDITPTHDISRMFAVTEALVGQLYPATLLARLVSLEVSHRSRSGQL